MGESKEGVQEKRGEEITVHGQLRPGGLVPSTFHTLGWTYFQSLCCCLLSGLQTPLPLAPSVLDPNPEKRQLPTSPLNAAESQDSFLLTLKADRLTFTGHHLIPNPYLNHVTMHNQPNIHYLGPDFSRFSLVNKQLGRSKGA